MPVRRNAKGELEYSPDGRQAFQVVKPIRCFPWRDRDRFVSLRGRDDKELALIEDLNAHDPAEAQLIRDELGQVFFVPKIRSVRTIRDVFGVHTWRVETDKGGVSFDVKSRDDIHLITDTRVLVKDADGNFYEIADVAALDARSRLLLDAFI